MWAWAASCKSTRLRKGTIYNVQVSSVLACPVREVWSPPEFRIQGMSDKDSRKRKKKLNGGKATITKKVSGPDFHSILAWRPKEESKARFHGGHGRESPSRG